MMKDKITSLRKTARLAGLLFLIIVLASFYGHMYVPMQIFVKGDAAATAGNILSHEFLFRSCIVVGLIETAAFLLLALTLYRLLKEVNDHHARLMLALVGLQMPLALVFAVVKFVVLVMLRNNTADLIPVDELPGVIMLLLNSIRDGSTILGAIGNVWLLPLGMLVLRSRFIPQILGILLIVAGAGHVIHGVMVLLLPAYPQTPIPAFAFFVLGEIPMMLWLLIRGVKDHISITVRSEVQIPSKSFPQAV